MCGVLTQIGQVCLTKSLQSERIAKVAVLNYIGLIYALIFGVTIFGEHYTVADRVGISLVVAGVLLAVLYGKTPPTRSHRGDGNGGGVGVLAASLLVPKGISRARNRIVLPCIRILIFPPASMKRFFWILTLVSGLAILAPNSSLADGKDYHDQDLKGKDFTKDDLKGADFSDAVLKDCNFYHGNLPGANFKGADVQAQFAGANAKGCDFREAKLNLFAYEADFSKCNFEGVDVSQISLLTNKFREANLQNTKGWGQASSCDFSKADLRGANLRGMNWMNSDAVPRFRGAIYDDDTTWPEGFDPKAAGAVMKAAEKKGADEAAKPSPSEP